MSASVAALRVQAARVDQQAAEIERLRAAARTSAPQRDLRELVEGEARAAGLALASLNVRSADEVEAVLANVPFTGWIAWLSTLQAQQVRVQRARIEALAMPGMVSVTASFTRGR